MKTLLPWATWWFTPIQQNSVFPGLNPKQIQQLEADTSNIVDPVEKKKAQQEIYRYVLPQVQSANKKVERIDLSNTLYNDAINEKDPEVKKQKMFAIKTSDIAWMIKEKQGLPVETPDNEVMDVFMKDNPLNTKLFEDYINNWDETILYQNWLKEQPTLASGLKASLSTIGQKNEWPVMSKLNKVNIFWLWAEKLDELVQQIPVADFREWKTEDRQQKISDLSPDQISKLYDEFNSDSWRGKMAKWLHTQYEGDNLVQQLWNVIKWNKSVDQSQAFQSFVERKMKDFGDVASDVWLEESPSIANMLANIPWDTAKLFTMTLRGKLNPLDTTVWLYKLAFTKEWHDIIKQKYWTWEWFKQSIEKSPVNTANDVLTLIQLWSSVASKWANLAWAKNLWAKLGEISTNAWNASDMWLNIWVPKALSWMENVTKNSPVVWTLTKVATTIANPSRLKANIEPVSKRIAKSLQESALKSEEQALWATKAGMKRTASNIAPEMAKRGIVWSRESLYTKASENVSEFGEKIDNYIKDNWIEWSVKKSDLIWILDKEMDKVSIEGTVIDPTKAWVIDTFKKTLKEIPWDLIEWDKLQTLKKIYQTMAKESGWFWLWEVANMKNKIANSLQSYIRETIASSNPDLANLNKEFHFWKSMSDVLWETLTRTKPQSWALQKWLSTLWWVIGWTSTWPIWAIAGYLWSQVFQKFVTWAFWKTVSAQLKNSLATALWAWDIWMINKTIKKINATAPEWEKMPEVYQINAKQVDNLSLEEKMWVPKWSFEWKTPEQINQMKFEAQFWKVWDKKFNYPDNIQSASQVAPEDMSKVLGDMADENIKPIESDWLPPKSFNQADQTAPTKAVDMNISKVKEVISSHINSNLPQGINSKVWTIWEILNDENFSQIKDMDILVWKIWSDQMAYYSPKNKHIVLSEDLLKYVDDTSIKETIYEEAIHALRDQKWRWFDDTNTYIDKWFEKSAKKWAEYFTNKNTPVSKSVAPKIPEPELDLSLFMTKKGEILSNEEVLPYIDKTLKNITNESDFIDNYKDIEYQLRNPDTAWGKARLKYLEDNYWQKFKEISDNIEIQRAKEKELSDIQRRQKELEDQRIRELKANKERFDYEQAIEKKRSVLRAEDTTNNLDKWVFIPVKDKWLMSRAEQEIADLYISKWSASKRLVDENINTDFKKYESMAKWKESLETKLWDILNYQKLFESEPDLENVKVTVKWMPDRTRWYIDNKWNMFVNSELSKTNLKSTLLHETQHVIQKKYDVAWGISPDSIMSNKNNYKYAIGEALDQIKTIRKNWNMTSVWQKVPENLISKAETKYTEALKKAKNWKLTPQEYQELVDNTDAFRVYQKNLGETEARMAENFKPYTDAEVEQKLFGKRILSESDTKLVQKQISDIIDNNKWLDLPDMSLKVAQWVKADLLKKFMLDNGLTDNAKGIIKYVKSRLK